MDHGQGDKSVIWDGDEQFTIGPTAFRCMKVDAWFNSTAEQFCVFKPRSTIDHYERLLAELAPAKIVELGIFRGGSTAMVAALTDPTKLVAVELSPDRIEALDDFIEVRGLAGRVEAHYSVDQGNRAQLAAIVDEAFGTDDLDLVFDDASHHPDLTRVSFDLLFPRVRPGGVFVIEDWRWPPLSVLILEQVLGLDAGIADITINRHSAAIRRSDVPLDRETFALRDYVNVISAGALDLLASHWTPENQDALRSAFFKPSAG